MSQFDGTGEKKKDGGDSGAFRGRRHPLFECGVDWKSIEKARYGGMEAGLDGLSEIPSEIDFEITGLDPRHERIQVCIAAVRQLSSNPEMWYRIRECLLEEYRDGGPKRKNARAALLSFVDAVNRRLGSSGEIRIYPLIGLLARNVADAEGVGKPELSVHVNVNHPGGSLGPIGVCFPRP